MVNILVTGGAGFIGSHLCERLSIEGHNVTSLDNYFTGSTNNHVRNVSYISGSTETINDTLRSYQFDMIYHLGEYSRVEQSFADFEFVWKFNKLGTHEVLRFANKNNAKLIYAGSSTKFADQGNGYITSPYAWSKASNTEYVKQYCEWNNLDYAITYFYNVYGPREISQGSYATVIAKFIKNMQTNSHLTIVRPGTQKRNFTHIQDIVDGLILVGFKGLGDEYGIGSPNEYSIEDVADMMGGPKIYLDERKGNRLSARVVTNKTRALGWRPKYSLEDYINNMKESDWR